MSLSSPTLLLILDGYGLAPESASNAAACAKTPFLDSLFRRKEMSCLEASGRAVGLPAGFIGNSEVGHLNIGAGRVVYQDMTKIDISIESGEFSKNPVLLGLLKAVSSKDGRLHLCGLLSDGGVHSHINHVEALLALAQQHGIKALVHAFLDGRDTPPTSAVQYVARLKDLTTKYGGELADMTGRFYAMDRDKHWERIKIAWDALIHGTGSFSRDPVAELNKAYSQGETDEFLKPRIFLDPSESTIQDNDGVFFFNFRADRGRELAHALTDPDFSFFDRGHLPLLAGVASMTSYDASLPIPVAFHKDNLKNTMGELLSQMGCRQLRIAETEKYAHVTYFFNGGKEEPFPGEERILIESPRDVATYDLKPEMSAHAVTKKLIEAWSTGKYDFAVCNLANPDMVGHTGNLQAAIKACETVDACASAIAEAVRGRNGVLCITADHGNVEKMLDDHGQPHTAHTLNKTPLVLMDNGTLLPLKDGRLCDIMPTLLDHLGITVPAEMTGTSLLLR